VGSSLENLILPFSRQFDYDMKITRAALAGSLESFKNSAEKLKDYMSEAREKLR
jgi:hypothetical protein